jgi:hypothetical protein
VLGQQGDLKGRGVGWNQLRCHSGTMYHLKSMTGHWMVARTTPNEQLRGSSTPPGACRGPPGSDSRLGFKSTGNLSCSDDQKLRGLRTHANEGVKGQVVELERDREEGADRETGREVRGEVMVDKLGDEDVAKDDEGGPGGGLARGH